MKIEAYWKQFLQAKGLASNTQYYEAFGFGIEKSTINNLLKLVLEGKKTATASNSFLYEVLQSKEPVVGDLSIVLDGDGNPSCVIETIKITKIKFKDMTYQICKREGEDENLESWRNNHIDFFSKEAKSLGYEFNEEMIVLFEDFKVIYK